MFLCLYFVIVSYLELEPPGDEVLPDGSPS